MHGTGRAVRDQAHALTGPASAKRNAEDENSSNIARTSFPSLPMTCASGRGRLSSLRAPRGYAQVALAWVGRKARSPLRFAPPRSNAVAVFSPCPSGTIPAIPSCSASSDCIVASLSTPFRVGCESGSPGSSGLGWPMSPGRAVASNVDEKGLPDCWNAASSDWKCSLAASSHSMGSPYLGMTDASGSRAGSSSMRPGKRCICGARAAPREEPNYQYNPPVSDLPRPYFLRFSLDVDQSFVR